MCTSVSMLCLPLCTFMPFLETHLPSPMWRHTGITTLTCPHQLTNSAPLTLMCCTILAQRAQQGWEGPGCREERSRHCLVAGLPLLSSVSSLFLGGTNSWHLKDYIFHRFSRVSMAAPVWALWPLDFPGQHDHFHNPCLYLLLWYDSKFSVLPTSLVSSGL